MPNIISTVLVKISLEASEFNRRLDKAQRGLFRMGRQMSIVGTELTNVFTIPLLAAGAAALKFGGDLDAMERGLAAVMKTSIPGAREELDKLIQTAKTPGLGLKQTIQASISLQAMELSADQARAVIVSMGKAVDNAGGSAENFERGMFQVRDILAKNKLEMRDWKILVQAIPSIQTAANKAFNKTGVSLDFIRENSNGARDALSKVLKEANKLRGTGGSLKNTLDNIKDAFFLLIGSIGKTISETLDIRTAFDSFITKVEDKIPVYIQWIKQNGELVKKLGKLALKLAVLGPFIRILGSLTIVFSKFGGVVATAGINMLALVGNAGKAKLAIRALASATLGWVGLLAAAAIAGKKAMDAWHEAGLAKKRAELVGKSDDELRALLKPVQSRGGGKGQFGFEAQAAFQLLQERAKAAQKQMADFDAGFGDLNDTMGKGVQTAEDVDDALDGLGGSADDTEVELTDLQKAIQGVTGDWGALLKQQELWNSVAGESQGELDAGTEQLEFLRGAIDKLIESGADLNSKVLTKWVDKFKEIKKSLEPVIGQMERLAVIGVATSIESDGSPSLAEAKLAGVLEAIKGKFFPNANTDKDSPQDASGLRGVFAQIFGDAGSDSPNKMAGIFDNIAAGIFAIGDLWGASIESRDAKIEASYQKELKLINASRKTDEAKQKAIAKLEEETARKRKKLARQEHARKKIGAIFESIINTAVAVTKVIANPILAAIVGVLGAAQTAVIAGTPLPGAAEGAFIGSEGAVNLHPNEVVLPLDSPTAMSKMMKAFGGGGNRDRILVPELRIEGDDAVLFFREALSRNKARGGIGISDVI